MPLMEVIMTNRTLKQILPIVLLASLLLPGLVSAGGRQEEPDRSRRSDNSSESTRIDMGNAVDSQDGQQRDGAPGRSDNQQSPETDDTSENRPLWALIDHPMDDQAVRNISGVIDDGYVPVGMDIGDDRISMLYASSTDIEFDRWIIHEFTELGNLNNEFSAFLLDGWLPMDISKTADGLSVLFVRGAEEQEILGWRIQEISAAEPDAVLDILGNYRDEGFLPYGITIEREDNEFWFLLLQSDRPAGSEMRRVALNGFTNENIQDGITGDIRNNLLPWGLARGNEGSFVLYIF
jgi:hypothetical protein